MTTLLEQEIERAVEGKLAPRPARRDPASPVRSRAPVVRFSPLFEEPAPATRRRRRALLWASIATHVVVVAVVMMLPERARTLEEPSLPLEIVFTAPMPTVPERVPLPKPPEPVAKPRPEPPPKPPAPEPPKPVVEAPKPPPKPVITEVEAPRVAKVEPPRPRPEVRTGLLDEIPAGPAIVASKASRSTIVAAGFDSKATAAPQTSRSGRVTDVAFDTQPAKQRGSQRLGAVVTESGFGVEAEPAPVKPKGERPASALDSEVEILSKPKPAYTEEARALRLEGDVVLDVTFEAGGTLRVLGVAQGLGHGLDEAAIDAARKIRFNPARRDGAPVDHTAKLRVVFRLA